MSQLSILLEQIQLLIAQVQILTDTFGQYRLRPLAPPDTTPPTTPGSFAVSLSGNFPSLSWTASTDNVGVTGYDITPSYAGVVQAVIVVTSLNYLDTGAPQNTVCAYFVKAQDAAGNLSTATSTLNVTTPNTSTTDVTPPPTPVAPTLVSQDNTAHTYQFSVPTVVDPTVGGHVTSGTKGYFPWVAGVKGTLIPQPTAGGTFTLTQIGPPAVSGSDTGSTFTAGGSNHYSTTDDFTLNAVTVNGDFDESYILNTNTSTYQWSKMGLEWRATVDPQSIYFNAFSFPFSPGNGLNSEYRSSTGGQAAQITSVANSAAVGLRLTRVGNLFTSFYSTNIVTPSWVQLNQQTITAPATGQLGRFGCMGLTSGTVVGTYTNFSITAGTVAVYNGAGLAGTTYPVGFSATDNAGNESVVGSTTSVTFPAATVGTSRLGSWSIGGSPRKMTTTQTNQWSKELRTVIGTWAGWSGSSDASGGMTLNQVWTTCKAANSQWKGFTYYDPQFVAGDTKVTAEMQTYNFALRATYPSGAFSTTGGGSVGNPIGNTTSSGSNLGGISYPKDNQGRDYQSWVPAYVEDTWVKGSALGLGTGPNVANSIMDGFVFDDIHTSVSAVAAGDWLRTGSANSGTTADVQYKNGWVSVLNNVRAKGYLCGGNVQYNSPFTEYNGQFDINLIEGGQGEVFSQDQGLFGFGFAHWLAYIQTTKPVTRTGGYPIFIAANVQSNGSVPLTWTQSGSNGGGGNVLTFSPAWQGIRQVAAYCFVCTDALLFSCGTGAGSGQYSGQGQPYDINILRWFGFFSVNSSTGVQIAYSSATDGFGWLGTAVDSSQTTAWLAQGSLGVYRRRYSNGTIFLNPKGNGAQTVALGATYKKLTVTDDPSMNGGTISTWSANDGDALFVLN